MDGRVAGTLWMLAPLVGAARRGLLLRVVDNAQNDTGTLDAWQLEGATGT